jgi:hypothetical protein
MVEHEVLGTSGLLVKECAKPAGARPPGAIKNRPFPSPAMKTAPRSPARRSLAGQQAGANRRVHNRVALQLPMRVRSFYGTEEFGRSENVSRGGVCYITDRQLRESVKSFSSPVPTRRAGTTSRAAATWYAAAKCEAPGARFTASVMNGKTVKEVSGIRRQ